MSSLGHGIAPRMKALSVKRSATVAALDIGTSKIVCLIARLKPCVQPESLSRRSHAVEILGIGHTRARGMKGGTVIDLAEAEEAVRHAVAAAERMAGLELDSVVTTVSAGRLQSELFHATVHVAGANVTNQDIERVLAAGSRHSLREGRVVLHSIPIGYALDGNRSVRDPRGMLGKRLGVDMHVVTADAAALRNLMLAIEHCQLTVEAMVAAPYCSGLSVLAAGSRHSLRDGRVVLHSIPIGYALDGNRGVRDPRGMLGKRLGVDMHVVTADAAALRNLMLAIEHCHLTVEAMAAAPYVSGLSVLADDEADLGAAVIDMGAGTTTLAVFSGGHFVHADGFAVGGNHVTMDLARGLSANISDVERLKTLHGSVLAGVSDDREVIMVPAVGADDREPPHLVSRQSLVAIIKPRVDEILEMVRDRLAASPLGADPRSRVILTGGASQLTGVAEMAARILGRQVRVGRPLGIAGLPEAAKGAAFAAAAGLLVYPQSAHAEHFEPRRARQAMTGTDGYLSRVGRWLKESF